jgi:hypothetical protein
MKKLEWHISNFSFCNSISIKCESCSGIDPINPLKNHQNPRQSFFSYENQDQIRKATLLRASSPADAMQEATARAEAKRGGASRMVTK